MLGNIIINKNLMIYSKTKSKSYSHDKLMNYLENTNLSGLSGNIEFHKRLRNNLKLSIVNKRKENIHLVSCLYIIFMLLKNGILKIYFLSLAIGMKIKVKMRQ